MKYPAQHRTISFGTDGIRGNADEFPFDDYTITRIGYAIALWAREKYAVQQPKLLVGMDTRASGPRIRKALLAGLVQGGAVAVDAGVLPTPAVCLLASQHASFHAGVIISASHNPYFDNGIKVIDARRCKLTKADEAALIEQVGAAVGLEALPLTIGGAVETWDKAADAYVAAVVERFPSNFLIGKKIVIDAANGATAVCARAVFEQLGAAVSMLSDAPNGVNINADCGALHPESLQAAVLAGSADAGFAFDGDGDRIVAVGADGSLKDGDDILFLLLGLPAYCAAEVAVGTVVSNQGLELALQQGGKRFVRTAVGDKYIAAALEEEGCLLGAENSGHVIVRDYLLTGDGIFVALKVLEAVMATNNWAMHTFHKFPQKLVNVRVAEKRDLSLAPLAQIIAGHQERLGNGRLLVRYSGTEPLLRVMVEAQSAVAAETAANELAQALQQALSESNH